jgi:hypothetical protein
MKVHRNSWWRDFKEHVHCTRRYRAHYVLKAELKVHVNFADFVSEYLEDFDGPNRTKIPFCRLRFTRRILHFVKMYTS